MVVVENATNRLGQALEVSFLDESYLVAAFSYILKEASFPLEVGNIKASK